jgi:hypothetical protein
MCGAPALCGPDRYYKTYTHTLHIHNIQTHTHIHGTVLLPLSTFFSILHDISVWRFLEQHNSILCAGKSSFHAAERRFAQVAATSYSFFIYFFFLHRCWNQSAGWKFAPRHNAAQIIYGRKSAADYKLCAPEFYLSNAQVGEQRTALFQTRVIKMVSWGNILLRNLVDKVFRG